MIPSVVDRAELTSFCAGMDLINSESMLGYLYVLKNFFESISYRLFFLGAPRMMVDNGNCPSIRTSLTIRI